MILHILVELFQKGSTSKLTDHSASAAELLKSGQFSEVANKAIIWGIEFGEKLLFAIIIFIVGRWLIKKIKRIIRKLLIRKNADSALGSFVLNTVTVLLYMVLAIIIIDIVGIKTISVAALIGSAGLAIGLAVKDNLANFAGGVMLIINKPFRGGDYINAQILEGTVTKVGILYTTLSSFDNKTIYIPNGPLSTGNIINFNSQGTRRLDAVASVDYGADVEKVKSILLGIAASHPKILGDPKPFARMLKMNNSSVDFTLRVWVKTEDYWDVSFDLNEEIYSQLNKNGLNIPFPQMTVHMANKS